MARYVSPTGITSTCTCRPASVWNVCFAVRSRFAASPDPRPRATSFVRLSRAYGATPRATCASRPPHARPGAGEAGARGADRARDGSAWDEEADA
jgi:hypothetical protein